MNDKNIAMLCNELDKLSKYIPETSMFTSKWIAEEYRGILNKRALGIQTYRKENGIIKLLFDARTVVLTKNKDKLKLFVPVCLLIKKIDDAIKEIFEAEKSAKLVSDEMEKMMAEMSISDGSVNTSASTE